MARFYADIQGNRGPASRMGGEVSGIRAHIRGWNIGVKVQGYVSNSATRKDGFQIEITGGSNNPDRKLALALTWSDVLDRYILVDADGAEVREIER